VANVKTQLLSSVTSSLSLQSLEVNTLGRKVWEQTAGLLQFVSATQNGGEDTDDFDEKTGGRYFDGVRVPAFYRGLLSPAGEEEGEEVARESRLEVDYKTFVPPRLPDTVIVTRAFLR
jgi:hypothetical protein